MYRFCWYLYHINHFDQLQQLIHHCFGELKCLNYEK